MPTRADRVQHNDLHRTVSPSWTTIIILRTNSTFLNIENNNNDRKVRKRDDASSDSCASLVSAAALSHIHIQRTTSVCRHLHHRLLPSPIPLLDRRAHSRRSVHTRTIIRYTHTHTHIQVHAHASVGSVSVCMCVCARACVFRICVLYDIIIIARSLVLRAHALTRFRRRTVVLSVFFLSDFRRWPALSRTHSLSSVRRSRCSSVVSSNLSVRFYSVTTRFLTPSLSFHSLLTIPSPPWSRESSTRLRVRDYHRGGAFSRPVGARVFYFFFLTPATVTHTHRRRRCHTPLHSQPACARPFFVRRLFSLSAADMATVNGDAAGTKTNNKATVVLGAQWGDEGKGKVVDMLATDADLVCRCQVRSSRFWRSHVGGGGGGRRATAVRVSGRADGRTDVFARPRCLFSLAILTASVPSVRDNNNNPQGRVRPVQPVSAAVY